jgi:hypothetical protein
MRWAYREQLQGAVVSAEHLEGQHVSLEANRDSAQQMQSSFSCLCSLQCPALHNNNDININNNTSSLLYRRASTSAWKATLLAR